MLHIVNKSPFGHNNLTTCLRLAEKDAPIILIEDGVYAALSNTSMSRVMGAALAHHPIYALSSDLKARAVIDRVMAGVQVVDYEGFVDLVVDHGPTTSWL